MLLQFLPDPSKIFRSRLYLMAPVRMIPLSILSAPDLTGKNLSLNFFITAIFFYFMIFTPARKATVSNIIILTNH